MPYPPRRCPHCTDCLRNRRTRCCLCEALLPRPVIEVADHARIDDLLAEMAKVPDELRELRRRRARGTGRLVGEGT